MNADHYVSVLEGGGEFGDNSIVLTTNGRALALMVQTPNGRGFIKHLTPSQVHELKAMLLNWEKLYYDDCFKN